MGLEPELHNRGCTGFFEGCFSEAIFVCPPFLYHLLTSSNKSLAARNLRFAVHLVAPKIYAIELVTTR